MRYLSSGVKKQRRSENIDKTRKRIHYVSRWRRPKKSGMMDQRQRLTGPKGNVYAKEEPLRFPVGLSAANYYFLVFFISAAIFFIVWAALHDGYDDTPLIFAVIAAISFGASFVFVREVILRRSRRRAIAARRLSRQLGSVPRRERRAGADEKLTLKRNEEKLREIRVKSEAANVLGKFADAHKEVFDLCDEYLGLASEQLSKARPASPRIPALRKGSASAANRHRFHMLKWAEIKAREFTAEAATTGPLNGKIEAGENALNAVERAIEAYPEESALIDSRQLLQVFLTSAAVKGSIENAERAVENGSLDKAIADYRNALASLERFDVKFEERIVIYDKIQSEISRIEQLR